MLLNVETIFSPLEIGPAVALNRLMRSATHESASDRDGLPDVALMTRLYGDLAQGGVGLIVIGHTYVHPSGRAGLKQNGMQGDNHALAWESILSDVRKQTEAPIFVQLTYAGRQGYKAGELPGENDKRERFPPGGTPLEAYYERQIEAVIGAFGKAAARAAKAGFDGVQIHMAHGYLLSECLSRATNKRRDTWGGDDPANRRRLPMAVVDCVREAIGTHLALAVKLNGSDGNPPEGVEPAEAAETARELEARGVQLIEVSGGKAAQKVTGPETEAYLLPEARTVAAKVRCRVATVGGYRTVPTILKALGEGLDMVSLSRPLVREPDWPVQIRRDAAHAATCVSCDKCFAIGDGVLRCMIDHPDPPSVNGRQ